LSTIEKNYNARASKSIPANSNFNYLQVLHQIETINTTLKNFCIKSEKTFLEIGSKLQSVYKDSRFLTGSASSISLTIGDEILKKGITDLEMLLSNVSEHLSNESEKIKEDKTQLLKTHSRLSKIEDELHGFDRIVKRLRMLGISTKIESSRLNIEDEGFFTLAENVDRLSNIISDKILTIKKKAEYLLIELTQTAAKLDNLGIKQSAESEIILNKTIESLNSFKEKNSELSDKAITITGLSEDVTKNIGKIVSSIQFHDITRQQIEHISQALSDVANEVKQYNNEGENEITNLSMLCDVFELQSIQLSNSLKEFVNAVSVILVSLDNVGKDVSSILSHSFDFICNDEGKQTNCLKIFERELSAVSSGLISNIEIGSQLSTSIKSIITIVDDLSLYVNEIEEVGSEIEIIALNARVKAARFGTNGSALGVLAESIQRLSAEAKQQTGSTSAILVSINEDSQKLRTDLESQSGENANENILGTINKVDTLLGSMKNIEEDAAGKTEKLRNNVSELINQIDAMLNAIKIQTDAKEIINPIIDEINETVEFIKSNFDVDSNRNENTKRNISKYTMNSEREIHQNFAGNNTAKVFSISKSNLDDCDDNSLGDNVELF